MTDTTEQPKNGNGANGEHEGQRRALVAGAKPMPIVPTSMGDCIRMGALVVEAGMAPKAYKDNPQAAAIAIFYGLEIGLPPLAAMQSIAVINGSPSLYGDGAMALVRAAGVAEWIKEWIEGDGETMVAYCETLRKGEKEPIKRSFSVDDAKTAKLWNKKGREGQDTPWVTHPKRMLQMRARAFLLRDVYADVLKGFKIAEEQEDIERMVDVTPRPEPKRAPAAPESGPTMDGAQGSSPRAAEDQGGSRPMPADGAGLKPANGMAASPDPAPSDFPEMPVFLKRKDGPDRDGADEAEVCDEAMFSDPELARYMADLATRYAQAPDRGSVEEIKADFDAHGKPRMLPTEWPEAETLYGQALERLNTKGPTP